MAEHIIICSQNFITYVDTSSSNCSINHRQVLAWCDNTKYVRIFTNKTTQKIMKKRRVIEFINSYTYYNSEIIGQKQVFFIHDKLNMYIFSVKLIILI